MLTKIKVLAPPASLALREDGIEVQLILGRARGRKLYSRDLPHSHSCHLTRRLQLFQILGGWETSDAEKNSQRGLLRAIQLANITRWA